MAWAKNGTPDTLSSSGDVLTITDLTAYKFNQFLCHTLATGGNVDHAWTTDNNTNTDYAKRISSDGGADSTATSASNYLTEQDNDTQFEIGYGINIDGEEKLFMNWTVRQNSSGSGNAPSRREIVGKVDTTTNSGQYTEIDNTNGSAGSFNTDSNLSALGTD